MSLGFNLGHYTFSASFLSNGEFFDIRWSTGNIVTTYSKGDLSALRKLIQSALNVYRKYSDTNSLPADIALSYPADMKLSFLGQVERIIREESGANVWMVPKIVAAAARLAIDSPDFNNHASMEAMIYDPQNDEYGYFSWKKGYPSQLTMTSHGQHKSEHSWPKDSVIYFIEKSEKAEILNVSANKENATAVLNLTIARGAVQYLLCRQHRGAKDIDISFPPVWEFGLHTGKCRFLPLRKEENRKSFHYPEDLVSDDFFINDEIIFRAGSRHSGYEEIRIGGPQYSYYEAMFYQDQIKNGIAFLSLAVSLNEYGKPILSFHIKDSINTLGYDLMEEMAKKYGTESAVYLNPVEESLTESVALLEDLADTIQYLREHKHSDHAKGLEMIYKRAANMMTNYLQKLGPENRKVIHTELLTRALAVSTRHYGTSEPSASEPSISQSGSNSGTGTQFF